MFMKIKIKTFDNKEIEGNFNCKFYTSQINGRDDLTRIYVDNNVYHIDKNEKERIESILFKNDSIVEDKIIDLFSNLTNTSKKYIFERLFNNLHFEFEEKSSNKNEQNEKATLNEVYKQFLKLNSEEKVEIIHF